MHQVSAGTNSPPLAFIAALLAGACAASVFAQTCTNLNWHPYSPSNWPNNISNPRLAYDSTRNVMVAVGSGPQVAGKLSTATWEFAGGDWTFRHNTLFALCGAPVVSMGNTIVTAGSGGAFGGGYNCFAGGFQTWLYSGNNWIEDTSPGANVPSARSGHAMAFDSHRGVIVLFGGANTQLGDTYGDTWEYNGQWSLRTPPGRPSARSGAAMTYDSVRRVIVMTAGSGPSGMTRETWEYNGVTWTQRGGVQPPAMTNPRFAFDPDRHCAVLYGGTAQGGGDFFATWEYRAGTWTQISSATPTLWDQAGVTYDPVERAILLYDSDNGFGSPVMRHYGCTDPVIESHPPNRNLCAGSTLYLSVDAYGIGDLSFQWTRGGFDIPGETNAILIRQPVSINDAGVYRCRITSPFGPAVTSDQAVVTVDSVAPTITGGPFSRFACEGTSVTFTIEATNPRSYQWRRGGVEIPGATAAIYTIPSVTIDHAGFYDCIVTNNCGLADSASALLTVNEPPSVYLISSSSVTIDAGDSTTMNTAILGSQPISRRWYRNACARTPYKMGKS